MSDIKTLKEVKKNKPLKFYSLDNILKYNAIYNLIYGERSNGKTYAILDYGLKDYVKHGHQIAYIRRYDEEVRGRRLRTIYDALIKNGLISKYTNGVYDTVVLQNRALYLAKYDEELKTYVKDTKPFLLSFALTQGEHDKSTSYPDVWTIFFDECLTREGYLPDEFVLFMQTISTIVRQRKGVKIFMAGNTVNKYSPYALEMGLKNMKTQEQGTIDLYKYGESDLTVAVEYSTGISKEGKPSDVYFAFNNPKLQMITKGSWELDIYPHFPEEYRDRKSKYKNIIFTYYIIFDNELLQADIYLFNDVSFTYIHRKTTSIKDPMKDLIYTPEHNARPNYRRKINKAHNKIETTVASYFLNDKVFYQDNDVGDVVFNYLQWCNKSR